MPEYMIDTANMEIDRNVEVIRCRACKWLGRETVLPGEYRCDRTERVTGLYDFCSRSERAERDWQRMQEGIHACGKDG